MSEVATLTLSVAFDFFDTPTQNIPFSLALKENRSHWVHFWETGAAISFNTTVTRAFELERRIILSLYLLAIQSLGSFPSAETGLTVNSWYGKFHLEMHPFHALFAPFWGKGELLKRSLWYYQSIRESAQKRAQEQGYEGLRWPKMTEPNGSDAPSVIGCLLCWQQPHLILFAVALKRSGFSITEYLDLIEETITFMISYLQDDGTRLNIGAPVIPAQENHDPVDVLNPTMEIEYWYWALGAGITLVEEAGRGAPDEWKNARRRLALPPSKDGLYLAHEKCPDTYTKYATDHPSFLFSYGFIPGERIDPAIMAASLEKTKTSFNLTSMWGWDFPAMAMSATRLGNFDDALELLLLEAAKNTYRVNGHNAQGDRADLPLYLPGNGAILLAVAMMVQHGAFPAQWGVEAEGFYPYL